MSESLPAKWSESELGDLVTVCRPRSDPQDFPHMPFVGMDNVEAHTMRLLGTVQAGTMRSNATHFLPQDVLYGRLRPYLNKVLAPTFEGLASAEFIPLTPEPGVDRDFVRYRLNAADFVSFTSHLDEGDRPRVDWNGIRRFPVSLPPSPEQRRIVEAIDSYLSRLDAAVASIERVQAKLKAYRASVLKAAVEGRLVPTEASLARAEKRDYEPAQVLLACILKERRHRWEEAELHKLKAAGKKPKDDKWKAEYEEPVSPADTKTLPELPEGWCWATVDEFLSAIEAGKNFRCEERPPNQDEVGIVKVSAVTWGTFDEAESKTCTRPELINERDFIRAGDFLFSRANTIELVGACVIAAYITKTLMLSDKILRLRLVGGADRWLLWCLRSPWGRREIQSTATGNQESMRNVSQRGLRRIRVPVPPESELQRLVAEIERRLSTAQATGESIAADLRRCSRLRQGVLKWAFEGKLVDQDPTDEPAESLLARIRAERPIVAATRKSRARTAKGAA